jgi:hypothetical protein
MVNNFSKIWTEETWEYRPIDDFDSTEGDVDHSELSFIGIKVIKNLTEVTQVTIEIIPTEQVVKYGVYALHIWYKVGDLMRWQGAEHFGQRFEQMTWSEMKEHFALEEASRGL